MSEVTDDWMIQKKEKRKHKEESDNDYSEDDYKPAVSVFEFAKFETNSS